MCGCTDLTTKSQCNIRRTEDVSFALIATHLLSAGIISRYDKTPINNSQQTNSHTHAHTHTDQLTLSTKLQAAGNDTKTPIFELWVEDM